MYINISNSNPVIPYHVERVSHTTKINGIGESLQMMTILSDT